MRPLALLAASGLLLGCQPPADPRSAVLRLAQEPETLTPFISPMQAASVTQALFYSGLFTLDPAGRYQPDLAERVPSLANGDVRIDRGGMRVRYRLRAGVVWHDGSPFGAQDLIETWRLIRKPGFPAVSLAGYDRLEEMRALGPGLVEARFAGPYAPFLELFPFVLSARAIRAGRYEGKAAFNAPVLGTGPYTLAGWTSGDQLIARANPRYFRGRPRLEKLVLRVIPNEASALQAFRAGGLDLVTGLSAERAEAARQSAGERALIRPGGSIEQLLFNHRARNLSRRGVRQAIAHLIDREALRRFAYGPDTAAIRSEWLSEHWAHHAAWQQPYDPARAIALLEAEGWKPGATWRRQLAGGRPLALKLVTTNDKPARALAAQIWRQAWGRIGIDLTIETLPATMIFGAGGRLALGDFDLALISTIARPDPDPSFRYRSDQWPPAGQNRSRYASQEVDRLLASGVSELDPARRKAIYARLSERLASDLPSLPLLRWATVDAQSPRLLGFVPNSTIRGPLWNAWDWHLASS